MCQKCSGHIPIGSARSCRKCGGVFHRICVTNLPEMDTRDETEHWRCPTCDTVWYTPAPPPPLPPPPAPPVTISYTPAPPPQPRPSPIIIPYTPAPTKLRSPHRGRNILIIILGITIFTLFTLLGGIIGFIIGLAIATFIIVRLRKRD